MPNVPYDRLVRKEVALGLVREFEPPQTHIGLAQIAPFMDVQSDDVIFDYVRGETAGLAPARAEDAESEMAGKDDSFGTGRASLIDWAIKDHWDPSDISRYREALQIGALAGATQFPLTAGRMVEEWQGKLARATRRRRKMLDNRLEWLIMEGLFKGTIAYNDGKIIFSVSYGRPGGQQDQAPASGLWSVQANADPISDILAVKKLMRDTYGVNIDRAVTSQRVLDSLWNLDKFKNVYANVGNINTDPNWTSGLAGGADSAIRVIEAKTQVRFQAYDAVYRTRPLGSNTVTNTRFSADDKIVFLPSEADVNDLDDEMGFAKTLTSPHPEGDWTSGYYEWERATVDPWGYDQGTGIKAFPVFPHLDLTYVMDVL